MRKKLMLLLMSMLVIALAGAVMIPIIHPKTEGKQASYDDKLRIVTTFYPVYLIGLNFADQIDDMEIKSLTNLNTGCLHDYQLTTEDMKIISEADVLVVNGGGMEGFLEDIRTNYPGLAIIDTSQGIVKLKNEEQELEDQSEEKGIVGEEQNQGEYNPHVWLNPKLYTKQIENFRDGLIEYINVSSSDANVDTTALIHEINQNAQTYIQKVSDLDAELEEIRKEEQEFDSEKSKAVIFHDSFAYLADRIGMEVAFTVPLDSDTSLSAGDIAEIIDAVKKDNIKYLFTEEQYSDSIAKQIEAETNARVYIINSVVTGEGQKDSYMDAMENNIKVIKEALQKK